MLINAMVRVVNVVGIVVFIVCTYASLSLVTQSSAVADPVIGSECTASRCLFNPSATLDTSQVDDQRTDPTGDAAAEGRDVLMVAGEASPVDLWNALVPHAEWYDDEGTNGNGTFYVPTGTVVDVPGGLYLATLDGWAECRDDWFAQECSATGPVHLTHTPALPADHGDACAVAAGLTLDALNRGVRIEEDLSYAGMPDVVAACNDELATAYYGQGGTFGDVDALVAFLDARSVPQASATPSV